MKYRIFNEDFVYVALNVKGYGTDLLKFPSDIFSKFPKNSVTGMVEIEEVKKVCSKIWVDKCGIISYDEALKNSEVIISSMITEVYDEIIYKYSEFIRMTENIRYCENIKELVLSAITEAVKLSTGEKLTRELSCRKVLETEGVIVTAEKVDENTISFAIKSTNILPGSKLLIKYFTIKGPWN